VKRVFAVIFPASTIVLLVLLAIPAAAQWQRRVLTPKGERTDTPLSHPLSYFTQYPSLRDEDRDFCYLCTPEKSLAVAKQRHDRAEVTEVGKVREYSIYDVFYFFDDSEEPSWKSILISTQPNQYREIWHYQRNEGGIWPSFLVEVGNEILLGLQDDCYKQDVIQEYYWFGKDGPIRVDLAPIWEAAKAVVPEDTTVDVEYDGRTDLPEGTMNVGLIKKPAWRCCTEGVVEVKFSLNNGRVVVNRARLDPAAEFKYPLRCR
jgi:hypothetical protein